MRRKKDLFFVVSSTLWINPSILRLEVFIVVRAFFQNVGEGLPLRLGFFIGKFSLASTIGYDNILVKGHLVVFIGYYP